MDVHSKVEPIIGARVILNPPDRKHLTKETIFNLAKNNVLFAEDINLRAHSCVVMSYAALEMMDANIIRQALSICDDFLQNVEYIGLSENIKENRYHLTVSIMFVLMLLAIASLDKPSVVKIVDRILIYFDSIGDSYKYRETIYNINRMLMIISCLKIKNGEDASTILSKSISMTSVAVSNYTVDSNEIVFAELSNAVTVLEKHKSMISGNYRLDQSISLACRLVGNESKSYFLNKFNELY